MNKINLYYKLCKDGVEIDLRELPFKNKIRFAIALLRNKMIKIHGNGRCQYE